MTTSKFLMQIKGLYYKDPSGILEPVSNIEMYRHQFNDEKDCTEKIIINLKNKTSWSMNPDLLIIDESEREAEKNKD